MKDFILIIFVIIGLIGLLFLVASYSGRRNTRLIQTPHIEIIDGCQYLQFPTYYGYYTYTHRGNCTNQIHRSK